MNGQIIYFHKNSSEKNHLNLLPVRLDQNHNRILILNKLLDIKFLVIYSGINISTLCADQGPGIV